MALRTFTTAAFCCATSGHVASGHLDSPFNCNKRCEITLSVLLPPAIYQRANSVSQTHSRDTQKPRWSFSVIWEAEKEIEWDLSLLSLFVHSPEVSSYLAQPHFAVLAGSSNFLLCSFSSASNTLAFCLWNISIRHLFSLRPLTQWPYVRRVTVAIRQPRWRTPRSANSIWSYLPSSHSAESVSVSGGVSKDHYHILSMSSFMAPV